MRQDRANFYHKTSELTVKRKLEHPDDKRLQELSRERSDFVDDLITPS